VNGLFFYFEAIFDEKLDRYTDTYEFWQADMDFVEALQMRDRAFYDWRAINDTGEPPEWNRQTEEIERRRNAAGSPSRMRGTFTSARKDGSMWWKATWIPALMDDSRRAEDPDRA